MEIFVTANSENYSHKILFFRYIDGFTKTVAIVKPYDRGVPDRNVVCFVPNEDLRLQALQAGAVMAGGHELIMEISKGKDLYQV